MNTAKKLLLTTTMALTLGLSVNLAQAADADIDASVITRNALVVTKDTDMNFGQLDVNITDQAGDIVLVAETGLIDVSSTTGSVVYTGTGGDVSVAGQVTVETDAATAITVTCTGGTMGNGTGDTLAITDMTLFGDTGSTTAEADCMTGLTVTPTAEDVILKVGGKIADLGTTNTVVTGNQTYSTTTGGTAPNIEAVYP